MKPKPLVTNFPLAPLALVKRLRGVNHESATILLWFFKLHVCPCFDCGWKREMTTLDSWGGRAWGNTFLPSLPSALPPCFLPHFPPTLRPSFLDVSSAVLRSVRARYLLLLLSYSPQNSDFVGKDTDRRNLQRKEGRMKGKKGVRKKRRSGTGRREGNM